MLLHAESAPVPRVHRPENVFLLALLLTLLTAITTAFGQFALASLFVGALLAIVLHRISLHHREPATSVTLDKMPTIDIAAIHVGGDAGGLIFVLGSVVILALGLPTLRWFLIASVLVASILAAARIVRARA
jgi:hypothetical protein